MHDIIQHLQYIYLKGGFYTYKHKLEQEKRRIKAEIDAINKTIQKLPKGELICAKNGKGYKWYLSNGKNPIYLHKREKNLAEDLAKKKYLNLKKQDLLSELNAIDSYLKASDKITNKADNLLTNSNGYRNLLADNFKIHSKELLAWQNDEYLHNDKHPENLRIIAKSGNYVRSKSEAMIDSELFTNKIPYRYECALPLGNYTVYPDFTIRHPISGIIFYWEHFGAMDDPNYSKNVFSKLEQYNAHGIIPNINLITTYETSKNPLGIKEIDDIIERYFL